MHLRFCKGVISVISFPERSREKSSERSRFLTHLKVISFIWLLERPIQLISVRFCKGVMSAIWLLERSRFLMRLRFCKGVISVIWLLERSSSLISVRFCKGVMSVILLPERSINKKR